MNRRQAISAALLLTAAAAAAALAIRSGRLSATTAQVQRQEFATTVRATGKLEAAVAFEVGPPSARDFWNYNLSWIIPEGSRVEAGAVVARFDANDIDERLREHRAALETARQERDKEQRNLDISLRQLRLDLVKAESELKTLDLDLAVPEGIVAGIELERARERKQLAERRAAFLAEKIDFEKSVVRSKLELLDVKKAFAEQKIEFNETVKEKFTVKAPVSGLVVYVPKRNGDRWEVGESVWMLAKILKVADISTLRIEAAVLEIDAARIAVGQSAQVTVDAIPGLSIDSSITELGRIVHERSAQDPSKVFDAILPIPPGTGSDSLRPGMGVKVEIETSRLFDQLTVPLEAIVASPDGMFVEVEAAGGIERRAVELGPRNRDKVVVRSGLAEGERVRIGGAA